MIEATDDNLMSFLKSKGTPVVPMNPIPPTPTGAGAISSATAPVSSASAITQPMNTVKEVASSGSSMISEINSVLKNAVELMKIAQDLGMMPKSAQRKLDAVAPQGQPQAPPSYEQAIAQARTPTEVPAKSLPSTEQVVSRFYRWFIATFEELKSRDPNTSVADVLGLWKQEEKQVKQIMTQIVEGVEISTKPSPATESDSVQSTTTNSSPSVDTVAQQSSEKPQSTPNLSDSSSTTIEEKLTANSNSVPTETPTQKSQEKIGETLDTTSDSLKSGISKTSKAKRTTSKHSTEKNHNGKSNKN